MVYPFLRKYFPVILLVLILMALVSAIYRNTQEKEIKTNIIPKDEIIETVFPYSPTLDFIITRDTITGDVKSYELRHNKLTLKNIIHAKNN